MKGIEGNFMAEPRVLAHSAMPVSPSEAQIVGTEERGCTLYIGNNADESGTSTLVVKMEGSHQTATMAGPSYVAVFTGVPNGSFLPILVTHVLEDNSIDLAQQLSFAEEAAKAAEERVKEAESAYEEREKELEEAKKEIEKCLDAGGTDEACDNTYGPAVNAAGRAVDEANAEVKNAEDALAQAEKNLEIAQENADAPAATTNAANILALF